MNPYRATTCTMASATGALCAAMIAMPAQAQSTVTITGIIDVNVRVVKNDETRKTLSTNGPTASNISFRGTEDLGGGLKAGFWLESTVGADAGVGGGANSQFWDRKATLGLTHARYGELRMGRDYVPSYANISRFDPLKANGVGNANNLEPTTNSLGSAASTLLRANNTVSYFTPSTLGGFFVHAMVAAGEGTPGNKYRGARVGYAAGPFEVAVSAGATEGNAAGDDFKVVNVGGVYDFGWVRPMGFWQKATFNARRQDNWLVGVAVPAGAGEVRLSYQRADQSGAGTDANDATQVAASYFHALSKRTGLYATVSRVDNKGRQTYRASSSGGTLTAGNDSTGTEVGITHAF